MQLFITYLEHYSCILRLVRAITPHEFVSPYETEFFLSWVGGGAHKLNFARNPQLCNIFFKKRHIIINKNSFFEVSVKFMKLIFILFGGREHRYEY